MALRAESQKGCRQLLDICDPRTLDNLMARAGLQVMPVGANEFLSQQRLITDKAMVAEVAWRMKDGEVPTSNGDVPTQ